MARTHGMAGEWARVKGTVAGLWPLFVGLFAAGFALAVLLIASVAFGAMLLAMAVAWVGWSIYKGARHVESYFKGARGEEREPAVHPRG